MAFASAFALGLGLGAAVMEDVHFVLLYVRGAEETDHPLPALACIGLQGVLLWSLQLEGARLPRCELFPGASRTRQR